MRAVILVAGCLSLYATAGVAQTGSPTAPPGTSGTDWAAVRAEAEAQTAAYNAAKAAADARAAMIAAEVAARRAEVGAVAGQTSITGATAVATGAAKPEAMLLVAQATNEAATAIATSVSETLAANPTRPVLIVTDISQLSTTDAIAFDLAIADLRSLMNVATEQFRVARAADTALPREPRGGGRDRSALTVAGAVVDLASKLGSYFLSDYSFAPVEVVTPPNASANAVINALRAQNVTNALIVPSTMIAQDAATLTELATLRTSYVTVAGEAATSRSRASQLKSREDAGHVIAAYETAEAMATRALTAYDTLRTNLATVTEGQGSMAARVTRQRQLQALFTASQRPFVLLISRSEAAELYTRRNLWTFIGAAPLHTMGGVAMTYGLYDGRGGAVLRAGQVTRHSGYHSVSEVERVFAAQ